MRAEIWARPGAATFQRIWEDPQPSRFSGTPRLNGTGDGEMSLPDTDDTATLADLLAKTDPGTPANSTRALVRVFADGDVAGTDSPLHEWRVESVVPPTDENEPFWQVNGLDTFDFPNDAAVFPWDWDGTDDFTSLWPDWVWGGRNLIHDIQSRWRPHVVIMSIGTNTGGTFTLTVEIDGDGGHTTGNINWNASTSTIATAIEALSSVTDVSVSGSGSDTYPWEIQFLNPAGDYTITLNSSLTGGSGEALWITIDGDLIPRAWEESKSYVSGLPHGVLDGFRLSDGTGTDPALPACDTSGYSIAFNGAAPTSSWQKYPGVQIPLKVTAGGIYQASVWLYAQGATADVRVVVRDLDENGIAATPGFSTGTTLVANTWTELTISDVQIPTNVTDVLLRVAYVGSADPPAIFVACPSLREGLAATTVGNMISQLYDDATTNHSGDGRIVWYDESTSLPGNVFLVLDFDGTNDSASVAWTDSEVSYTAKRGFSYGRVLADIIKLGYDARIVPAATDGQWKLQLYNPGTLGTDYTGDDAVGIRVGREVIRKAVRRFTPVATQTMIENGLQGFSLAYDTNAITALGRLEYYQPERDLGTLTETGLAASSLLTRALSRGRSIQPVLLPAPTDPQPFVDYTVGDIVDVDDSGTVISAQITALTYAVEADTGTVTFEPALSAETFVGNQAIAQGVRQLLAVQDAIRRDPPESQQDQLAQMAGGGKAGVTLLVAASDSLDSTKERADFICDGVNDNIEIQTAIDAIAAGTTGYGTVELSEGEFQVVIPTAGYAIDVPSQIHLVGQGQETTYITDYSNSDPGASSGLIRLGSFATLRHLSAYNYWDGSPVVIADSYTVIEDCWLDGSGDAPCIEFNVGSWARVLDNYLYCSSTTAGVGAITFANGSPVYVWITGNYITGGYANIANVAGVRPNAIFILGNTLRDGGYNGVQFVSDATNGPFWVHIQNNVFANTGTDSAGAPSYDAHVSITGSASASWGDYAYQSQIGTLISGNNMENESAGHGIAVRYAPGIRIEGNSIEQTSQHGILVDSSDGAVVADNTIAWPGIWYPSGTYDGINVATTSYADIHNNLIRPEQPATGGVYMRYAINIADAGCVGNVVVGNDIRLLHTSTVPINDAGTGTELFWPAHPTYGDNFTDTGS